MKTKLHSQLSSVLGEAEATKLIESIKLPAGDEVRDAELSCAFIWAEESRGHTFWEHIQYRVSKFKLDQDQGQGGAA